MSASLALAIIVFAAIRLFGASALLTRRLLAVAALKLDEYISACLRVHSHSAYHFPLPETKIAFKKRSRVRLHIVPASETCFASLERVLKSGVGFIGHYGVGDYRISNTKAKRKGEGSKKEGRKNKHERERGRREGRGEAGGMCCVAEIIYYI